MTLFRRNSTNGTGRHIGAKAEPVFSRPVLARPSRATANSAPRMATVAESANAVALPLDLPNDGWFVVAPFGEHLSPDGTYRQIFQRPQAERIVSTWNSFAGRAVRWVHNVKNAVAYFSTSAPVWEGHPDVDADRWPEKNVLAQIDDLRVGPDGLEGRATFNSDGMAKRGRGPLKASPYWMHDAPDSQGRVFPELLLSVGLVPAPNIPNAPAWTRNSTENQNDMNQQQIAQALGLKADASWGDINAALQGVANHATALSTANSAATTAQTQLTTVQSQLSTATTERDALKGDKQTLSTANASLTSERDTLKTTNGTLTTANAAMVDALLVLGEARGLFTPAQKEEWKNKFTANAATAAKELAEKKPVLNTTPIGALETPLGLATANAAVAQFKSKVNAVTKSEGLSYGDAWDACMADPANAALVQAMNEKPAA